MSLLNVLLLLNIRTIQSRGLMHVIVMDVPVTINYVHLYYYLIFNHDHNEIKIRNTHEPTKTKQTPSSLSKLI